MDAIFAAVSARQTFATVWGYAERAWILQRKRNEKRLTPTVFARAAAKLQYEVLTSGDIRLLSIEDERVLAGLSFVAKYSLNSADAAILPTFVRYRRSLPPGSPACVLVAADGRLLRAAEGEGFVGLNPELVATADLGASLGGL